MKNFIYLTILFIFLDVNISIATEIQGGSARIKQKSGNVYSLRCRGLTNICYILNGTHIDIFDNNNNIIMSGTVLGMIVQTGSGSYDPQTGETNWRDFNITIE